MCGVRMLFNIINCINLCAELLMKKNFNGLKGNFKLFKVPKNCLATLL